MTRAYVSVGSNVAPRANVARGIAGLERLFAPLVVSPIYEARAVGFAGNDFLNLVVAFDTDMGAEALHEALRAIEDAAGRRRGGPKFADRTLDLDLLLYGDEVRDDDDLELPRPEILRYAFVLRPLADIAPDTKHPVAGQSFRHLWAAFDDPAQVLRPVVPDGETP
ncbi:MAG: 2-amino-4-hydroxy-6-hydroxymethyldihydropteridine diphosphokinase [Gammaproteobacteria bacterium]|nr:2-amino-4-hydroxy-6-hydroxymethyldihydropteridine diphosphokinase [Gammaproteobacteria bacterium]